MVPDDGLQSHTMVKPAVEVGLGDSHSRPFPSHRFLLVSWSVGRKLGCVGRGQQPPTPPKAIA